MPAKPVHSLEILRMEFEMPPGRPTMVRLHLRCGLVLSGLRIWRTSTGPRLILPRTGTPGQRHGEVFTLSRWLRREWESEILQSWRSDVAERTGVALPASWRRVA